MKFPERAVKACVTAMKANSISPRLVSNVLKYDSVDVSPIETFLFHNNQIIRNFAVQIIGEKGDPMKLIDAAKQEEDSQVLQNIFIQLSKTKSKVEELVGQLESKDEVIKNEAIRMFRKAGRSDCLFSLLFDDDEEVVQRIRGYLENAEPNSE